MFLVKDVGLNVSPLPSNVTLAPVVSNKAPFTAIVTVPPPSLSMVRAAGTPLALLTAYQALRMQGFATKDCGIGKRILITGASGGVGHFAVQLAKNVYKFEIPFFKKVR